MLTILLGENIIAKQQFLEKELAKYQGELTKYQAGDALPKLTDLTGSSLFGTGGAYVFFDCIKHYEFSELEKAKETSIPIYLVEESLDKRLKKTKDILAIAEVKEFPAPTYDQAPKWIVSYGDSLNINIQPQAAEELAKRLMGDTKKFLSTVLAHHELLKLSSFAGDKTITKSMVEELTPQDLNIDLFKLLDAIGSKNTSLATSMLTQYYESSTEDDKIATIRLVGLLSDQLRSLLITKQLEEQKVSDNDILLTTGWKSGRLFIMKKLSRNFSTNQLSVALTKFYNLDKELKSSTMPPRIIVQMIVASL